MLLSLDFETSGIDIASNTFRIISTAFTWEDGTDQFCTKTDQAFDIVKDFLKEPKNRLLVYNLSFEGPILLKYGVIKDFTQIVDVWRLANYANNTVKDRKTSLNASVEALLGVPDFKKPFFNKMIELGLAINDKEAHKNIAKLPMDLLKEYNCLDTKYTLALYRKCIEMLKDWGYLETARADYVNYSYEAYLYAVSYLRGVVIDREKASNNVKILTEAKELAELESKTHKDVLAYEEIMNKDLCVTDSDVRKLFKAKGETVSIKKGTGASMLTEEQIATIKKSKRAFFNPNSSKQKKELFIDMLGEPILSVTKSGAPSLSKNVLRDYGQLGKLLASILAKEKEITELGKLLDLSEEDGMIHMTLRSGSTISGRSSSKVN